MEGERGTPQRPQARGDEGGMVCEHHQGQAARLRVVLEELIAHHEEQAAKLMEDEPKGAA